MMPITHGMRHTSEYRSWNSMLKRCNNPKQNHYHRYGGRGILVCDRWKIFQNFIDDMGKKPTPKHQIDRKNNNGNYEPNNCRWATRKINRRNTSVSKRWVVNGVCFLTSTEAGVFSGISKGTVKCWCDGKTTTKYYYPPRPNCYSYPVYPK